MPRLWLEAAPEDQDSQCPEWDEEQAFGLPVVCGGRLYGKPLFSVQAGACTEIISFPFFNREPDVKLSVRRCRVHGSFRGRDRPAT